MLPRRSGAIALLVTAAIVAALVYEQARPFPHGVGEVRRIVAADARQGVAVGPAGIYAIGDQVVARLNRSTGRMLARWQGSESVLNHINSCFVRGSRLICAASNYPATPMKSGLLLFDAVSLQLQAVRNLNNDGSLTWLDWHGGSWWACYANYDRHGGVAGRDHRATTIVRYDTAFLEQARYRLPEDVLAQLAPGSASGGAWGQDGRLYITGHDRPQLYVLGLPSKGNVLRHAATLPTASHGQAFAWDPATPRLLWTIERADHLIIATRIPRLG